MARYPGVSRLVGDVAGPRLVAESAAPAPSASPAPRCAQAESKPAAVPERPAIAVQAVEAKNPPPRAPSGGDGATIHFVRVTSPAPTVQPAALEAPQPADPLDLGNGVRRLPPVE